MAKERNYKRENEIYKSKPDQIAKRVARNKMRREMIREGVVSVGDNKELDHVKPLSKGGANTRSNIRVTTKSKNSSFSRNADKSVKKNTPKK